MISAGNTGIDDPPGITAFKFLTIYAYHLPIANNSLNGMPNGTSKLPGLLTCPVTLKNFATTIIGFT